jgi:hypothetical protein
VNSNKMTSKTTDKKNTIKYDKTFKFLSKDSEDPYFIKPTDLKLLEPNVSNIPKVGTTYRSNIIIEHKEVDSQTKKTVTLQCSPNIEFPVLMSVVGMKQSVNENGSIGGKYAFLSLYTKGESPSDEEKETIEFLEQAETHLRKQYVAMAPKFGYTDPDEPLTEKDSSVKKLCIIKKDKDNKYPPSISVRVFEIPPSKFGKNKGKEIKDNKMVEMSVFADYDKSTEDNPVRVYSNDLIDHPFKYDGCITVASLFHGATNAIQCQFNRGFVKILPKVAYGIGHMNKPRLVDTKVASIDEKKDEKKVSNEENPINSRFTKVKESSKKSPPKKSEPKEEAKEDNKGEEKETQENTPPEVQPEEPVKKVKAKKVKAKKEEKKEETESE